MEAKKKRNIKPGHEYNKFFPASENDKKTIRRNANLDDTISFIPKVVGQTTRQTTAIARKLKGKNVYDTCKNIWHFVYGHINYRKDADGFEQIRSPSRSWHDRKHGVDCDCYSVFISSILTNLGIRHILRITKYHRDYFQHIYPIVPNGSKHITIDCVTDEFDFEVPYSEKKDYPMDLQYLNGFEADGLIELGQILERNMYDNSLAGKVKKKAIKNSLQLSQGESVPKKKKKGFFKKALNVVNKVNPATVLLRNGVLAAMKLNIMNAAKRLRWSYLSPDKLAEKNIDPQRFQKLVATRQKLENIFFNAGGNPNNLRKAILKGKGNKDKQVSGLGNITSDSWSSYMNENTPIRQLLGSEIYYSENVEGMQGFGGFGALGEPATAASIASAMGVVAGIVAALKKVGDIFKSKGSEGSEDFDEAKTTAAENNVSIPASVAPANASSVNIASGNDNSFTTDSDNNNQAVPVTSNERAISIQQNSAAATDAEAGSTSSAVATSSTTTNDTATNDNQGFWDKNKKWLKPVAIGAGSLTIIAIGMQMMKNKSSPKHHSLSGTPHKRKRKKKKNHHRRHHHKKAVMLL